MAVKASSTITLAAVTDVDSVTPYYRALTSTLSPPSKPTAVPPSGWSATQPAVDTSKTCYIVWLSEFSDGTWAYSDVSTFSEYEAAKAAQITANSAKAAADTTGQYFWFTSTGSDQGAHVTQTQKTTFESTPSGGNVRMTNTSLQVRNALVVLAEFLSNGARFGAYNEDNVFMENVANLYAEAEGEQTFGTLSLGGSDNYATVRGSSSDGEGDIYVEATGKIEDEDATSSGQWISDFHANSLGAVMRFMQSIGLSSRKYEWNIRVDSSGFSFTGVSSGGASSEVMKIDGTDGSITTNGDLSAGGDINSTTSIQLKGYEYVVRRQYSFTVTYSAGTVGTRGYQGSANAALTGYTIMGASCTSVGNSSAYMPVAFTSGSTLYLNAYRASTAAVSNSAVTVTVIYRAT